MKKYKNLFIGLSLPISLTLLPIIVSCKKNEASEEQTNNDVVVKQEIDRINNLKLSLNTTLLFKDQITKDNLLTYINGLIKNNNFDYSIDQFANDGNSIILTFVKIKNFIIKSIFIKSYSFNII